MTAFRKTLIVIGFIFSTIAAFGSAQNIYITQSGAPSGSCTSNVQNLAFLNNAANWGNGASQIGPGTTVLLCGTFVASAGTAVVTVHGNGANGNPILLKFDTGTSFSAPYFTSSNGTNGAITINGFSYVTVDGGTPCGYNPASGREGACNGSIFATANGTNLPNQQASYGFYVSNTVGVEIRNLRIYNQYVKVSNSTMDGSGSIDVLIVGSNTNISVHDCDLSEARAGISYAFENVTNTGANFYNNYIHHHDWGIQIGAGNDNSVAGGINIYGNEITDWNDWADTTGAYHTDGLIAYSFGSSGASVALNAYNNYLHGDLAGGVGNIAPVTAFLYCNANALCAMYNNLIVSTGNNDVEGLIWFSAGGGPPAKPGQQVYNNTIVGGGSEPCIGTASASITVIAKNNICLNADFFFNESDNSFAGLAASDHNVMYNLSHIATDNSGPGPPNYVNSLQAWQAATHGDANSTTASPNLDANYIPQASSSAIGRGANLAVALGLTPSGSGTGIQALTNDKQLSARSATLTWDAGAYNSGSVTSNLTAPTGLSAAVQ